MPPPPSKAPVAQITAEVLAVLADGASLLVGSCDASAMPHALRATGLRIHEDGRHATVYLPEVTSRNTVTDVAVNPRVAVVLSQPLSHRSYQLKGAVVSVGPAPEEDKPFIEAYLSAFAHVLEVVGMPYEVVTMISHWPSIALVLRIDELYLQTPGPGSTTRSRSTPTRPSYVSTAPRPAARCSTRWPRASR